MTVIDPLNKTAIITGAGSGIGLSLAKELYARGCSILIGDLRIHPSAQEWVKQVERHSSPKVVFHQADVSDWKQLDALFDVCERELGDAPDIVIPGAGLYEPSTNTFWNDLDEPSHYKIFDINILHPIQTSRIAIRRLRAAHKPGVIVHLSSITAQIPSVVNPLYSVSKQAISQFVRCMAPLEDLAGIRVVAVAPGVVDTPLFRDSSKARAHIDLENDFVLPPEEVVKAIIALITDVKYAPGTILEVGDIGGWREVSLLNDVGPQGRSTLPRQRAKDAINLVDAALKNDTLYSKKRPVHL